MTERGSMQREAICTVLEFIFIPTGISVTNQICCCGSVVLIAKRSLYVPVCIPKSNFFKPQGCMYKHNTITMQIYRKKKLHLRLIS